MTHQTLEIGGNVLLVPPSLYDIAEKILHTKELLGTRFGNYIQTQYKNEKPEWKRCLHYLEYGDKFNLNRVIRRRYYDENCYVTKSFHLPKAMRKQGYYVRKYWPRQYMQEDYEPKICKRRK